jgi:hypothetical protein
MKKLILLVTVLIALAVSVFLVGGSTQDGRLVIATPYETQGERVWFATTGGTGNCRTWETACTFRTALTNCSDTFADTIYLGVGVHEADNGADATGTDVTNDYVHIVGVGHEHMLNSTIANSDAAATHILTLSGDHNTVENLIISNVGQTDEAVTHLNIQGDYGTVDHVFIPQDSGAASGVGILIDNSNTYTYLEHVHMVDLIDACIQTNSTSYLEATDIHLNDCGIGVDMNGGAGDDYFEFYDAHIDGCTTGIDLAAATTNIHFYSPWFVGNTTNVTDAAGYGELSILNPYIDRQSTLVTPADAGTTVTGAAGAYAQGNLTQIIAADAITSPFRITRINIQSATANNIYKVELSYGEATGDTVLGIFEFVDVGGVFTPPPVDVGSLYLPTDSYVGAKIASSSGGGDNAVITLEYQAL